MPAINYYFSLLSPFVYLAGDKLEQIANRHSATIRYHPVDMATVGGSTGWTPLPQRHPSRVAYRLQDIARIADRESVPVNLQPAHYPTDAAPASFAVAAAALAGADAGRLARGFSKAVWAEDRDISNRAEIDAIIAAAGITEGTLADHLVDGEQAFHSDTAAAADRGVFGVPFYIVGDERFWGQDRLPELERHLAGL